MIISKIHDWGLKSQNTLIAFILMVLLELFFTLEKEK